MLSKRFSSACRGGLIASLFLSGFGFTGAFAQTLSEPSLKVETVASGLSAPVGMAFLSADELLVLEKNTGIVKYLKLMGGGTFTTNDALDLDVSSDNERGLLGIALDPDFATNGFVYLFYSQPSTPADTNLFTAWLENRVARFTWNPTTRTLEGPPFVLVSFPYVWWHYNGPNHNGGVIAIGPDKKLWGITGDMNRDGVEMNNSSTITARTGGIFRINLDGSIPSDNPFIGDPRPEIQRLWGYGVRNSFGMAFDPLTGSLWDTENGVSNYDEINLVPKGFNSGWKKIMGPSDRNANPISSCTPLDNWVYSEPEYSWFRAIGVTAIAFLSSDRYSGVYRHRAIVGDINFSQLYWFKLNANRDGFVLSGDEADLVADNETERNASRLGTGFSATDLRMGRDGFLYCTSYSGKLLRIVPSQPNATLAGTVSLPGFSGSKAELPLTLTLKNGADVIDTIQTTLDANGNYSVSTPTLGTYDVVAKVDRWLSVKTSGVALSGEVSQNFSMEKAGDVDGNNTIDDLDLFALTQDFLAAPGSASGTTRTDLNGDGAVDDFDLFTLTQNFLMSGQE